MKRQWIKLYLEITDDPKMGRLPDRLWRRAIELFMLAGEQDDDGLLPAVEDMAWRLRTSAEEVEQTLQALNGIIVQPTAEGWLVTKFKERQFSESYERVKRYRNAKSNADGNADVAEKESSSTSSSDSILISSEGGGAGEGTNKLEIPSTPRQAMANPYIQAYKQITGGFPGENDYGMIIDTFRYFQEEHGEGYVDYLMPYWTAWSTRKGKDGKPYNPGSRVWYCEWAMQGEIPRANGHEPKTGETKTKNQDVIRKVAQRAATR